MEYSVGTKGQVVIAKEIRDRLGVEPGWVALQQLVGDHVEIFFVPPTHRRSLMGVLGPYIKRRVPEGVAWDEAREQAWASNVGDSPGPPDPR